MHVATPPAPCPPPTAHLALPFFDAAHRTLALGLLPWAAAQQVDETDDRAACRDWVRRLGAGGWLRYCVPAAHGGAPPAATGWGAWARAVGCATACRPRMAAPCRRWIRARWCCCAKPWPTTRRWPTLPA